jgi:hypothetical protein
MFGIKAIMLFICFSFFALALPACKEKAENPVSQYGDSLIKSYKGAQNAAEQANLDAVQKTVNAYRASNEGYPKSLQDIENMIGSSIDLTKYDYDPATGTVTLKPKQ